ncbi:MAG: glutamate/aspartate:proton symporter GltP [Crocinitomicaceae bacterium]|jgi:aerobic C4-dicarboxylate transport protein|nr:glutamate/aspartate:proton symporter GltP [Crocinitomicaceae bacterium]
MKKVLTHLTFYVLLAIIIGIWMGAQFPEQAKEMKIIGETFIFIIKLFVVPIIFLTVTLGISSMGDLKKVGKIGLKSLIYFEIVTTLALAIGIIVAMGLQPGNVDMAELIGKDATKFTTRVDEPFSWLNFLKTNLTIVILVVAIITGIVLNYSKKREKAVHGLEKTSKFVFLLLKYVMYLAPLGAFGGIAFAVGEYGLKTLVPLGKLVGSVYLTMLLFILLVLGLIMRIYKLRILQFLRYIREEIIIVLGTSSSETALPNLMQKLEKLGCKKSVVNLVVPTGYSFNLDGTSIYLSMAVIFLAQLYHVHLSFGEILAIIGILMITSKGAAGVTGSGFVVLASTLASVKKIPLDGLAFLLAVDKFLSEARAITNIIGNGVATLVIAKSEKEFDAETYEREISRKKTELK